MMDFLVTYLSNSKVERVKSGQLSDVVPSK